MSHGVDTRAGQRLPRGFTLVELISVLALAGVLAAVAVPRLLDRSGFAARGARDFIAGGLRYAQKSAIAMRRNVCASVSGSTLDLTYAGAAGSGQACLPSNKVTNPGNGLAFSDPANALPGGTTLAGRTVIVFDGTGRPHSAPATPLASALALTLTGNAAHPLTVEPETGYIH